MITGSKRLPERGSQGETDELKGGERVAWSVAATPDQGFSRSGKRLKCCKTGSSSTMARH